MEEIRLAQDVVTVSEFKAQAAELLKRVLETDQAVVITQNGKPAGVVISPSSFDALREHMKVVSAVEQGLRDIDQGHVTRHEDARQLVLGRIKAPR